MFTRFTDNIYLIACSYDGDNDRALEMRDTHRGEKKRNFQDGVTTARNFSVISFNFQYVLGISSSSTAGHEGIHLLSCEI